MNNDIYKRKKKRSQKFRKKRGRLSRKIRTIKGWGNPKEGGMHPNTAAAGAEAGGEDAEFAR